MCLPAAFLLPWRLQCTPTSLPASSIQQLFHLLVERRIPTYVLE